MTDDEHNKLDAIHKMAEEAREIALESSKSWKRVEDHFFGKDGRNTKNPTRAEMLDEMIFGFKAGKWVYRVTLGFAAFFVAVGGIYGTVKGWKP